MSRPRAYELIGAAQVTEKLSGIPDIPPENLSKILDTATLPGAMPPRACGAMASPGPKTAPVTRFRG